MNKILEAIKHVSLSPLEKEYIKRMASLNTVFTKEIKNGVKFTQDQVIEICNKLQLAEIKAGSNFGEEPEGKKRNSNSELNFLMAKLHQTNSIQ